jgi:hypothetical protein
MCGIAGIWYRDGQLVSPSDLKRMADDPSHHDPNGTSFLYCFYFLKKQKSNRDQTLSRH